MVAVDATTSVFTSRQRFLRCGLRNFRAGGDASHWHRPSSRLARSAALPRYSRSEVLSPRFPRSHSANHPINNLDPSGHDSQKTYKPPQTQQAQQHNPTSSTSTLTGSGALAGKTQLKPSPSQLPDGRRVIRPNDRPRTPENEPAEKPGEPAPSEPGETPAPTDGTTPPITNTTGAGADATTGTEAGTGAATDATTVGTVGGGDAAAGAVAGPGALAFLGVLTVDFVHWKDKAILGQEQQDLANQNAIANYQAVHWVKSLHERHPAAQPKDKPAPTTQPAAPAKPGSVPAKPSPKVPHPKADETPTTQPAEPAKKPADEHGQAPVKEESKREEKAPTTQPTEKDPSKGNRPGLVSNPKHHPNSESPEPHNVKEIYNKSIEDKQGRRWAKDEKGVIHRFSKPSNGKSHWNGSTAGPKPIKPQNIPHDVRRKLK